MLKSLNIKNYQSWAEGAFNFHPGLNVIIGLSDAGKSAIVRSLRKVIWNRPLGDDFRSIWGGDSCIEVNTDTHCIARIIKDNENVYLLDNLIFKAFGTDVPKEISDALNINDINLHQQQDSFFLLKDTPGEVAAHFNKIANLEKIGIAQSNIKKWINAINSTISYKTEDFKKEKEKLLKYDFLETFEIKVGELEDLESKLNLEHKNKQELQNLIDNIAELKSEVKQEKEILKIEHLLNDVLIWIEKRDKETRELNSLIQLVHTITDDKIEKEELESIIPAGVIIDNLLQLYKKKDDEEKERYQLNKLVININNGRGAVKIAEQEYDRLHKEFEKEFPDICPLCNKPK